MTFDRVKRFAEKCRRRMSGRGCRDCGGLLPQGLYLKGQPSLTEMVRTGARPRELKKAMRERGWYCRKCLNRHRRMYGTAAATLRDQFATQEEYFEYLMKHRGPKAGAGA